MRLALFAFLLTVATCSGHPAFARDLGQWENQAPEIRAWYRNAELTPAARRRFPFVKCCDGADVVHTQFRVDKSSGADAWWWLDGEGAGAVWKRVPDDIIHWNESAPGGLPTLFVFLGRETCFFPPDAGI